jgi:hypothetical protein
MLGDHDMKGASAAPELEGTGEPEAARLRLPYATPRLRHLGSVRELTLASTGNLPDFNNARHHR